MPGKKGLDGLAWLRRLTLVKETRADLENLQFAGAVSQRMGANVMKRSLQIAIVIMALAVSGCAENAYPISGETCGPDDPVQTLDAGDCTVLPGI